MIGRRISTGINMALVTPNGMRLSCGALKKNDSFP
jgi:hypothetical protein